MKQKRINIICILLVKAVSGGCNLKHMIQWNQQRMQHIGFTVVKWQGLRKQLIFWQQMIVFRGLLPLNKTVSLRNFIR